MCGIAGFHVKDPKVVKEHKAVELFANELLKGIEHRGRDATGFVSVGFDGQVVIDKSAVEATKFIETRDVIPEGVRTVLLHTRAATQGHQSQQENNHPVIYGSCFAIHNGHINNDTEVFTEIDLVRNAEVDSSAIAAAVYYDGFADIKVALERLEGGMATAIIDPVRNPGELIIAKGKHSPLFIVDTEKFIVWASTKDTIKEAWAKIFGTPPADKNIESINDGTIILVKDKDVTRDTFTVKMRPFVRPASGQTTNHGQTTNGTNGTGGNTGRRSNHGFRRNAFGGKPQPEPDNAVAQARQAIQELIRAAGQGRNFDDHQLGLYDEDDFKDVHGDRKWHPCYGCSRLILEQDMVKTLNWGTICIDCQTGTARAIAAAASVMQDTEDEGWVEEEVLAGTTIPRIDEIDRDSLEIWAEHEMVLHRDTLEQLSKDCGSFYSPQAIEFLAFLTPPEYRATVGKAVNHLIDELREAYEATSSQLLADDHNATIGQLRGTEDNDEMIVMGPTKPIALLEAGGTSDQWGFCHDHEKAYKQTNGCSLCNEELRVADEAESAALRDESSETEEVLEGDFCGVQPFAEGSDTPLTRSGTRPYARSTRASSGRKPEDSGGEIVELPRCPECNTYILREGGKQCAVCTQLAARTTQNDGADEGTDPHGKVCVACTSVDVKFVVTVPNGKSHGYCGTCYSVCGKIVQNAKDRTVHLCNEPTKHTLSDGLRVCHQHVRKQSGSLSDTLLKKRGAVITEVQ